MNIYKGMVALKGIKQTVDKLVAVVRELKNIRAENARLRETVNNLLQDHTPSVAGSNLELTQNLPISRAGGANWMGVPPTSTTGTPTPDAVRTVSYTASSGGVSSSELVLDNNSPPRRAMEYLREDINRLEEMVETQQHTMAYIAHRLLALPRVGRLGGVPLFDSRDVEWLAQKLLPFDAIRADNTYNPQYTPDHTTANTPDASILHDPENDEHIINEVDASLADFYRRTAEDIDELGMW